MRLPHWLHTSLHIPYILHIKRHGRRGPKLVFIHGIAADTKMWQLIVHDLARDYQCIEIDLLGHGRSPAPQNITYSTDAHVRSLRWTLFWRGIWGKRTFVCHSMGGLIALRYASRHPRRTQKMILIALPIYKSNDKANGKRFSSLVDRSYIKFYEALRSVPKPAAIRSARALIGSIPRLKGSAVLNNKTWYPIVSSLANTIEQQSVLEDFGKLSSNIPVVIVYGRIDPLVIAQNYKLAMSAHDNTTITKILGQHELIGRPIYEVIRIIRNQV